MHTLHFVRHGQSTWNREGRLQGQTRHPELTAQGRADVRLAADQLKGIVARDAVPQPLLWSSDLVRAEQSAEIVGEVLGLTPKTTTALREQGLGELEGKLRHELVPQDTPPGLDVSEVRWGGGESIADVYTRVGSFLDALAEGEHILVSHGDTIRVALAYVDGRSHRDVAWDVLPNGGIVTRTR